MDQALLDRLSALVEFMRNCPRVPGDWLKGFRDFCKNGLDPARCQECISELSASGEVIGKSEDRDD